MSLSDPRIALINAHVDRSTTEYYFDSELLKLSMAMTAQSVVKHLLTEGDKFIVSRISSLEDQGGYAVASNYGMLIIFSCPRPFTHDLFASRFSRRTNHIPAHRRNLPAVLLQIPLLPNINPHGLNSPNPYPSPPRFDSPLIRTALPHNNSSPNPPPPTISYTHLRSSDTKHIHPRSPTDHGAQRRPRGLLLFCRFSGRLGQPNSLLDRNQRSVRRLGVRFLAVLGENCPGMGERAESWAASSLGV